MGRSYYYYVAEKKENEYYPILFERDKDGFSPLSVIHHNADMIDEEFQEFLEPRRVDADLLKGEFRESFCLDDQEDLKYLFIYEISKDEIEEYGGSGLVQGYMPIDTVIMAEKYENSLDEYKYALISAQIYADLPRSKQNKYMKVAYIDWLSREQIFGKLKSMLWQINTWDKEVCILAHYSY